MLASADSDGPNCPRRLPAISTGRSPSDEPRQTSIFETLKHQSHLLDRGSLPAVISATSTTFAVEFRRKFVGWENSQPFAGNLCPPGKERQDGLAADRAPTLAVTNRSLPRRKNSDQDTGSWLAKSRNRNRPKRKLLRSKDRSSSCRISSGNLKTDRCRWKNRWSNSSEESPC